MTVRWWLAATLLVSLSTVVAWANAIGQNTPKFDVTSVKQNNSGDDSVARIPSPRGVTITNATLQMMMRWAYGVQDFQIISGPSWLSTARFDVVGKTETRVSEEVLLRSMLRAPLVDRFMLVVHNETRKLPIYALVPARSNGQFGPQLRRSSNCAPWPFGGFKLESELFLGKTDA